MAFSVPEFEQRHLIECLQERNRFFPGSERAVRTLMAHPSFLEYILCIEAARRSSDEEYKQEQWDEALFIQTLILEDLAYHRTSLTNEDFLAAQDFMLNRTRNEEPLILFTDDDIQFSLH